MPETLVIRFSDPAEPGVDVFQLDAQGRRSGRPERAELPDCAARARGRRVAILLPGEHVSLLDAHIPSRKRQRILQAAPWVLEDRLAQDVDSLHFALGPRLPDDRVRIAVVGREDMAAVTGQCEAAGLMPDMILPDFLALPRELGEWTVLLEGNRVMVRTDDCDGFSTDRSLSLEMLDALIDVSREDGALPARIRLFRAADDSELMEALSQRAEAMPEIDDHPCDGAALDAWVPDLSMRPPLDLGTGEYRLRRDDEAWWRPWRPVVALAASWLMVIAITEAVHLNQLAHENQRLEQEIETVFRETLPDAERMVNPRLRMERRLNALRGGGQQSDFFPTLAALGQGMADLDQGRLQGISYRPGVIDLNIRVEDSGTLDRIRDAVGADDTFQASIQSANTTDDGVDGRLQIRRREN